MLIVNQHVTCYSFALYGIVSYVFPLHSQRGVAGFYEELMEGIPVSVMFQVISGGQLDIDVSVCC
jgi:hypothetical protein